MENNAIEYFDENGNHVAILIFDTNYADIEIIDKKLFKPMSELFPVDNSSETNAMFQCVNNWFMEDNNEI